MPMKPMHGWDNMGHQTLLDTHAGITVEKTTGGNDPVIVRNGAYFIKMYVNEAIAKRPKDFHGRGQ